METLFELTFQDQTLSPQVGTFTDTSQTTGTFTLEDGEYYLTNADTKGFYAYSPVAIQSGLTDDSKVIIEFDLKVVTASVNTHTIIGIYAGVDGSGIPTGAKITLRYDAGDIELVLGGGATATLIESADVVVDQWYHFRIDCYLAAPLASTYQVKIDGTAVTTVTGATTDYELGIISVLGTDLHACDECGIKNITFVTETNLYVGRTALDQVLQDVKGYVDSHCMDLTSAQTVGGIKAFSNAPVVSAISLDGKTIDTDANGNLVYDGHIVDTIEEQGTEYIRYTNGIQICWGNVRNNNNVGTGGSRFSFPMAFNESPNVVATPSIGGLYSVTAIAESGLTWLLYVISFNFSPIGFTPDEVPASYVAIGRWK